MRHLKRRESEAAARRRVEQLSDWKFYRRSNRFFLDNDTIHCSPISLIHPSIQSKRRPRVGYPADRAFSDADKLPDRNNFKLHPACSRYHQQRCAARPGSPNTADGFSTGSRELDGCSPDHIVSFLLVIINSTAIGTAIEANKPSRPSTDSGSVNAGVEPTASDAAFTVTAATYFLPYFCSSYDVRSSSWDHNCPNGRKQW
ncbi:MAG: hypothetical protein Q9201_004832 [Fulgogasparrea decipioides]